MTESQMNIVIDFFLGLLPPLCKKVCSYFRRIKKKRDFIKLINTTYIFPIQTFLIEAKKSKGDLSLVRKEIRLINEKLSYLKDEELRFLNLKEQFFYIRVTEFAKRTMYSIDSQLIKYEYVSFNNDNSIRQYEKII